MLTVGIPKEIKAHEKRVGLTPPGVRQLTKAGVRVIVEKGAGKGSDFSDQDYKSSGAEIASQAGPLYKQCGLIQKVKELIHPEWKFLKPKLILCSFLHLASPENRELMEILLKKQVTALGFETVFKEGRALFLEPMSEIAGALAASFSSFIKQYVQVAGRRILYPTRFLEKLEVLASQFPAVPENLFPGKSVVFGGGVVGRKATETLLRMGGVVDLVEKKEARRLALQSEFQSFARRFRIWTPQSDMREVLENADIWIGGVHVLGERAPWVLSLDDLQKLSATKQRLILDVAVDQGGNFPDTHSTTYEDPLYLDSSGNLRFGVSNIPSLCGRGASEAIEKVTVSYLLSLAMDWKKAFREFPELRSGLQIFDGQLVNEAVARSHQMSWRSFDSTLLSQ